MLPYQDWLSQQGHWPRAALMVLQTPLHTAVGLDPKHHCHQLRHQEAKAQSSTGQVAQSSPDLPIVHTVQARLGAVVAYAHARYELAAVISKPHDKDVGALPLAAYRELRKHGAHLPQRTSCLGPDLALKGSSAVHDQTLALTCYDGTKIACKDLQCSPCSQRAT